MTHCLGACSNCRQSIKGILTPDKLVMMHRTPRHLPPVNCKSQWSCCPDLDTTCIWTEVMTPCFLTADKTDGVWEPLRRATLPSQLQWYRKWFFNARGHVGACRPWPTRAEMSAIAIEDVRIIFIFSEADRRLETMIVVFLPMWTWCQQISWRRWPLLSRVADWRRLQVLLEDDVTCVPGQCWLQKFNTISKQFSYILVLWNRENIYIAIEISIDIIKFCDITDTNVEISIRSF